MESALTEVFPLGVYRRSDGSTHACARVGESIVDLDRPGNLDGILATGPTGWRELYDELPGLAARGELIPLAEIELVLPFTVADYVDFYASERHASNLGRIFRPGQDPLPANWRHQPIGYHGRSGTVVVSGTDVVRPCGHTNVDGQVAVRPTERLDVEVEVGFVVGVGSNLASPIAVADAPRHIFGVVLLNDWSARDIQAWETVPLGPFLGKSFQTSISPWVVPLASLEAARVPPASSSGPVSDYLVETEPWGLDISLELRINGELVSTPPYREMFWSPAQMLAHLTVNGASTRTGDLFGSGTVSGAAPDQVGSLIERGQGFLADGDDVVITATAPAADGGRIDLGEVGGRILPAR